jgi:crotonobetainyl-CoA:carnitine CoA-transferase CaiB-like acyl-CoA transferase
MSTGKGSLAGIHVLDLSRILAGPFCAQTLGDLGADVVKVERPGVGDDARRMGAATLSNPEHPKASEGSVYLSVNRNKRSVTINLAQPKGQALVRRLAGWADVLIENYRAGTLARYGLDYESLRETNPRLVYCSITGYGQDGPKASEIGYDPVFQAQSGIVSVTGYPDGVPGAGPMKAGIHLSDMLAGFNALVAIQAALLERERGSGQGQYIDIALLDCSVAALTNIAQAYLMTGDVPRREGFGGGSGGPAEVLDCEGGPVFVACGTDPQFARFARLLGKPELVDDERFRTPVGRGRNKLALAAIVLPLAKSWTREAMLAALKSAEIPCGPVNNVAEALADPQVQHRGMTVPLAHPLEPSFRMIADPIRLSRTPARYDRPPPRLGEHTDEVLRELLTLDAGEIEALRREQVI